MERKIDKRRNYYAVYDTETCNTIDEPMMYDFGFAIIDKNGKVYEKFSFVIAEVYCGMKDVMQSAYFADKLPRYEEELANGTRQMVSIYTARKIFHEMCKMYNVVACIAHNAPFDYRSTSKTIRYTTKSATRYFLPYGVELWDTMQMAKDTFCKETMYREWCKANGYVCKNGTPRKTAEVLYRYISGIEDFEESHTGLEDVLIEKEIFVACVRKHKPMRKSAF